MKPAVLLNFLIFITVLIYPQTGNNHSSAVKVPAYYRIENALTDSLLSIVKSVGLDSNYDAGEDGIEQISFAVIDLNSNPAKLGGVN
ncbi:MAG: hypothetical protein WAM24_01740, partial [Ignavibacteriaceae bacterium]